MAPSSWKFLGIVTLLFSLILSFFLFSLLLQLVYSPKPIIAGWRSYSVTSELNECGFRGKSIQYSEDDFIVVLIGDSHVESITGCKYEEIPEMRLEHHLNRRIRKTPVRVFSLGASGYGQDQELLVLQEYFAQHRADFVVLWFTPGNDIWNNMFPTHMPTNGKPKPTFWLEGGKLHGPNVEMGEKIFTHKIKIITVFKRLFMDQDASWEQYLPTAYQPLTEYHGDNVFYDWQERWDKNIGSMKDENLDNEKTHISVLLDPPSERMRYGLELTRQLLHKIEQQTNSQGGQFFVFGIDKLEHHHKNRRPVKKLLEPGTTEKVARIPTAQEGIQSLNGKYYKTSLKQFRHNITFVLNDFTYLYVPIQMKNWRVSDTDGHLNREATDRVMDDLAGTLEPFILDRM